MRIDTQPLTVWKMAALGDPNASNNGDADGDGIPNLMEFALGSNPQAFSRTDLPAPGVEVNATDGKHYNTMSYRRRINPGTLVYTLQISADLIAWAAIPAANLEQIGSSVPVGDGINEVVSFRVLPAVEDSPGAVSMRLSVTP